MKRFNFTRAAGLTAALLAAGAAPISAAQDAPAPAWQVSEAEVPLTGTKSVTAVLSSTNPIINMIGVPEHAGLVMRCSEHVLSFYVTWPQVLDPTIEGGGFTSTKTMLWWRIDDGKIESTFWDRSDSGTAAGKFGTGGATKVIARFANAHRLVVRMTGRSTQDAIFDLGDVAAVAARVGTPCGASWSTTK